MAHTLTPRLIGGKRALARLGLALLLSVSPFATAGALDGGDVNLYRQAFALAAKDRHDEALRAAEPARDRLPAKVLLWMKLQAPYGGTFAEITGFARENPDWPAQSALRKAAERVIAENLDDERIVRWFDENPPLTSDGAQFYADALARTGKDDKALRVARDVWITQPLTPTDEKTFLSRWNDGLRRSDHQARADRRLWDRDYEGVKRVRPLVGDDYATVIDARVALQSGQPGATDFVARVPGASRDDPGLLFDLARRLRTDGDEARAAEILARAPFVRDREDRWWNERNLVARKMMDRGDIDTAFKVVAQHRPTEGAGNVDADFMAGWLALGLGKTNEAMRRFQELGKGATSPITRARAAYWCGRAAEIAGETTDAGRWYRQAASYGTTFYGQLGATRVGAAGAGLVPSAPSVSQADTKAFEGRELVRATRDLAKLLPRDDSRIGAFARAAGLSSKSGAEYALAARLARDVGSNDAAIAVAKQAVRENVYLMEEGYPILRDVPRAPEPALIHSIIRQESTFNSQIVSSAGARGMMQLMPATARMVAGKLGVKKYSDAVLTTDPGTNIRLGSAYLADLINKWNGSYVLAVASYNAGTGRVSEWMDRFGDPRSPNVDPVDWIERIPFSETRNYVQRVLEATLVYRARMEGGRADLDIARDLRR